MTTPPSTPPSTPAPRASWPRRHRILAGIGAVVAILTVMIGIALVRLGGRVESLRALRSAGPAWAFPSHVYSDGVVLVPGATLPEETLLAELAARDYAEARATPVRPGAWARTGDGIEIGLRGFRDAPDPAGTGGPERVRVSVRGGRIAAVARLGGYADAPAPDRAHPPRLEPVLIRLVEDAHQVRRTWVPLARVPKVVREAVIASEDRRFYRHFGLDLKGNFRALATNVRAGGVRQGASTITQQLARGLFLGRERTWHRKLSEAAYAVGLETLLSKDQILEMYLNSVYWGQGDGGGVAGVEEASRWFFSRPVDSLGLSEAALLAGIIPAPNAYSPFRNPRLARARRNAALQDMVATGVLDARRAARARTAPLGLARGSVPPDRFPAFTGYVADVISQRLAPGAIEHAGLTVFTTLDPVWQVEAEKALASGVADLERWSGRRAAPLEGAFVALEPASGAVRALVGGRDVQSGEFNRAIQAHRQPGSAIKPIVYAAALDSTRGAPWFTPASTVPDQRRAFDTPEGPWKPENDEGEYHPEVTLAKALAKSLNVATANLVEALGPQQVARYAERFGLGKLKPVASIGLGTNEVTLLALTNAYATFPNRGLRAPATPLRAVVDARGAPSIAAAPPPLRVLPRTTADLMTGLLEDVVIFGVSYPLRATYGFTRPVGGKTGTTNDYNDAWFVGFTPDLVAGVWVGYDTPQTLGRPAAETALPVWAGVMHRLIDGIPARPFPADSLLELAWIDPWSGGLAGRGCPVMRVPFLPGTAPRTPCRIVHPPAPPDSTGAAGDSTARAAPDSSQ